MNNSLSKVEDYETSRRTRGLPRGDDNPLSLDLNVMRANLLFGGLQAISFNQNANNRTGDFSSEENIRQRGQRVLRTNRSTFRRWPYCLGLLESKCPSQRLLLDEGNDGGTVR